MDSLLAILQQVQNAVFRKRIRLCEFFKDFDPLKHGIVTLPQFRRCMQMLDIYLPEVEMQNLEKYFIIDRERFNYVKFCEEIDRVFTEKSMEKAPTKQLIDVRDNSTFLSRPNLLPEPKMRTFKNLLDSIRKEAALKGIHVRNCYRDLDPLRLGYVNKNQFIQYNPFKRLSSEQLQLLIERYIMRSGMINYDLFYLELEDELDPSTLLKKEIPLEQVTGLPKDIWEQRSKFMTQNNINISLSELEKFASEAEAIIQQQLLQHRMRLADAMKDFDTFNHGTITVSQFQTTFGTLKFPGKGLQLHHIQALCMKYLYTDEKGFSFVKYTDFLANVERVLTEKGLESHPTQKIESPYKYLSSQKMRKHSETSELDLLVERIRNYVKSNRIYLKPLFQDFDRTHKSLYVTNRITKHRFERALHMLGFKLSPLEYDLLCRTYDDLGNGDVNYLQFIHDVDFADTLGKSNHNVMLSPRSKQTFNEAESLDETMIKIRYKVLIDRIRLDEFMKDYDSLRSGLISCNQCRISLTRAGVLISDKEFEFIVKEYRNRHKPDLLHYKAFVDEINKVFVEKNLEAKPAYQPLDTQQFISTAKVVKQPSKSKAQFNEFVNLLFKKIREQVLCRRIFMKPFFEEYDPLRRGLIVTSRFKQCIARFLPKLNEEELQTLADLYFDFSHNEVNFMKFIGDVDSSEVQQHNLEQFHIENRKQEIKKLPSNVRSIVDDLRNQVINKRIRFRLFFEDYDRLRTGHCVRSKFETAIGMCKLSISKENLSQLMDAYSVSDERYTDHVNYDILCQDLELQLEASEMGTLIHPQQTINMDCFKNITEKTKFESLLDYISTQVHNRNLLMKPYFQQDYDPLRKGTVSFDLFCRVLDKLKLKFTHTEYEIIAKPFRVSRDVINYNNFLQFVESLFSK